MLFIGGMVHTRYFLPARTPIRKKDIARHVGMNFGPIQALTQRQRLSVYFGTAHNKTLAFTGGPCNVQGLGQAMRHHTTRRCITNRAGQHQIDPPW